MLSWAEQKKYLILGTALGLFVLAVAGPSFLIIRRSPSCFNGTQDGAERGIDCGGACALLCRGEALDPLIQFVRTLHVGDSIWGVVAYAENKNPDAGAANVPYLFKLYDEQHLLVAERRGEVYIPPNKGFVIFEGRIDVGNRTPTRATFEWSAEPRFMRVLPEPVLEIRTKRFVVENGSSRLDATLHNPALTSLARVETAALLFDAAGNVFSASGSRVNTLRGLEERSLSFTWPRILPEPARMEIFYSVSKR